MKPEVEAKFLHVDHDDIRARLNKLGAKLEHPMRLMKRVLLDLPDKRFQVEHKGRLRIRDEGDKICVNFKYRGDNKYSDEVETTIGSFDDMKNLFLAMGLHQYSYQESRRETWTYKNTEVVLDQWPWLDDYIEIEGEDEEAIKAVAGDLGFDWKDAKFGSTDTAYKDQYKNMKSTDSVGDISEVKFGDPMPKWLKDKI